MKLFARIFVPACCLMFAVTLLAQDELQRFRGTISAIGDGKITVKSDDGENTVALNDKTTYHKFNDDTSVMESAKVDDVKKDMWTLVVATKDGDTLAATQVFVAKDKEAMSAGWAKKHEMDAATKPATAPATEPATAPAN